MRDRSFERVYYFRGDDDFLKESTARELIGAVLDPATRDFNLELIRGDETSRTVRVVTAVAVTVGNRVAHELRAVRIANARVSRATLSQL